MQFSYTLDQQMGITICKLSGELIDKNQATEFVTKLDESIAAGNLKVILDLGDLKYMNSSGLNVMINVLTRSRKNGGETIIANVSPKVKELLVITKLNTVFTVADSMEKAISKLK